jgi:uncharacterized protein YutE (UPF0331/DUF86 family)
MKINLQKLASRICSELDDLKSVTIKIEEGWKKFEQTSDDFYIDSVALNIHGFYSGLERIFELIASVVDGNKPESKNWHKELLNLMAREVPTIRPAVISEEVCSRLNDYRGFRHIVRNVYTFKFDPEKIKKLSTEVKGLFSKVSEEILAFADFLDKSASDS